MRAAKMGMICSCFGLEVVLLGCISPEFDRELIRQRVAEKPCGSRIDTVQAASQKQMLGVVEGVWLHYCRHQSSSFPGLDLNFRWYLLCVKATEVNDVYGLNWPWYELLEIQSEAYELAREADKDGDAPKRFKKAWPKELQGLLREWDGWARLRPADEQHYQSGCQTARAFQKLAVRIWLTNYEHPYHWPEGTLPGIKQDLRELIEVSHKGLSAP